MEIFFLMKKILKSYFIIHPFKYLLLNFKGNLVLDADALNSLSKYGVDVLKEKACNATILTPHIKEFSRLSCLEIDEILNNSVDICRDFAKKYGVIVNLKNNVSVISDGEMAYLNINGNAGLAKGGSGDVLSGITLGLVNKNDNILCLYLRLKCRFSNSKNKRIFFTCKRCSC